MTTCGIGFFGSTMLISGLSFRTSNIFENLLDEAYLTSLSRYCILDGNRYSCVPYLFCKSEDLVRCPYASSKYTTKTAVMSGMWCERRFSFCSLYQRHRDNMRTIVSCQLVARDTILNLEFYALSCYIDLL